MRGISKFCIKHRVTTLLAFILVSVFGLIYALNLKSTLLPDMEMPMAVVYSYYNGASPEDMEELVTRPIEAAIMSVSGVKSVSSTSSDSLTTVTIEYENGTNLDIAATKLREKFELISLPDGASKPTIMNINISELLPAATVALMGDDLANVQQLAEDVVAPALERIDGVASVSIQGGVTEKINVSLKSEALNGYGINSSYVSQILAANNLLYPGGDINNGTQTLTVSTDAKLGSVEDVKNVIIPLTTGGLVRLSEIADVTLDREYGDARGEMNNTPAVVLTVSKASSANEAEVAEAVADRMEELASANASIVYGTPYLASTYIDMIMSSSMSNIIMGVGLAAIVVFLFLRRFGATLAIAISMPVCILTVFALMYFFDLTLNMMSIGGIAMGVGMIVDNSIVVLENIFAFSTEGKDRMTACVEGTKEVFLSLTASTLTTVVVFLPIAMSGGLAGQIFHDFCFTIVFLILGSLVIAVTLVPLLAYFLLDVDKVKKSMASKELTDYSFVAKLQDKYTRLLRYLTVNTRKGFLLSVLLVAVFLGIALTSGVTLLPDMDFGYISVTVSMPQGTELEDIAEKCDQIAEICTENVPEINEIYYIAQSGSTSQVEFQLVDKGERKRSCKEIANDLRTKLNDIPGCELTVVATDMTAMLSGDEISVQVRGNDFNTLGLIAKDLADMISELPDAVDVKTSLSEQLPQVKITVNREAASRYGLTAAQIGGFVRAELTGSTATTVTINNKNIDVVVKGNEYSASSIDALRSMSVTTAFGTVVPLSAVADVDVVLSPQSITRSSQARIVTVSGASKSGSTLKINQQVKEIVDSYSVPDGYEVSLGGMYEQMSDSFGDLGLALLAAIGLVYFVLASQFESFLMPVIIMLVLPVAFSGALFPLPLVGKQVTMISLVALIFLAGTVVNASIVLVDYIRQLRERGLERTEAVVNGCLRRVRPVLMTTVTTVLAILPMALGIGDANEMVTDMGIAMASGMTISTMVTLVFTPVFYCLIDNLGSKKRKKEEEEIAE